MPVPSNYVLVGSLLKFNMVSCDTLHCLDQDIGSSGFTVPTHPIQCRLILIIDHDKVSGPLQAYLWGEYVVP